MHRMNKFCLNGFKKIIDKLRNFNKRIPEEPLQFEQTIQQFVFQ